MRTDVWQRLHADLTPGVQPDQETYAAPLGPHRILLPIRETGEGRGVASLIINQAGFVVLDALVDALAERLRQHDPAVVVGLPTLGLPLAEGVARRLGHARMVPLGTSRKVWYDDALSVALRSSTTPGGGKRLYADPRMLPLLNGRVALVDDVLSSGASMAAGLRLLAALGVTPVAIGAAMLQGEGWREAVGAVPVEAPLATPILTRTAEGWT